MRRGEGLRCGTPVSSTWVVQSVSAVSMIANEAAKNGTNRPELDRGHAALVAPKPAGRRRAAAEEVLKPRDGRALGFAAEHHAAHR